MESSRGVTRSAGSWGAPSNIRADSMIEYAAKIATSHPIVPSGYGSWLPAHREAAP